MWKEFLEHLKSFFWIIIGIFTLIFLIIVGVYLKKDELSLLFFLLLIGFGYLEHRINDIKFELEEKIKDLDEEFKILTNRIADRFEKLEKYFKKINNSNSQNKGM